MNNLSNLSPVEVDTIYLERLELLDAAERTAGYAASALTHGFGRTVYIGGHVGGRYLQPVRVAVHPDAAVPAGKGEYNTPFPCLADAGLKLLYPDDVIEAVSAGHPRAALVRAYVVPYEEAASALADARLAVAEVDEEYNSRPWDRYWLVTTSDGHVHARRHCSTCNKGHLPTGFALVPYLSGKTAADAVADLGPALCSVCFPEAPVEAKEQARISARLALSLKQHGSEAFQKARQEAAAKAEAKAAARCPGSGEQGEVTGRGYAKCPCCGWSSRSTTGKVAAHRRPRFYAVKKVEYKSDLYWNGTAWGPSTKRVAFESREAALAVEGATDCYRE